MKKEYDKEKALGQGLMKTQEAGDLSQDYELSQEARDEVDMMVANATKIIHSDQQRDKIIQAISQGDPIQSIASEANRVFRMLEVSEKSRGKGFNELTMAYGGIYIVSEIINMGEEAGLFEFGDEEKEAALKEAIQMYFQDGIKEQRIDPIALQKDIEPLMQVVNPEMFEQGRQIAASQGIGGTV